MSTEKDIARQMMIAFDGCLDDMKNRNKNASKTKAYKELKEHRDALAEEHPDVEESLKTTE